MIVKYISHGESEGLFFATMMHRQKVVHHVARLTMHQQGRKGTVPRCQRARGWATEQEPRERMWPHEGQVGQDNEAVHDAHFAYL